MTNTPVCSHPTPESMSVLNVLAACFLLSSCTSSTSIEEITSIAPNTKALSCGVSLSATGTFSGNYHQENVCGWSVQVNRDLFNDNLSNAVFDAVNIDLKRIENELPELAVTHLKQVTIWLELNQSAFPGGVYHPSEEWLVENGYPSKWAKGVQLGVAQNYLNWTDEQPAMLLHELAHAYDDLFFASEQPDLLKAFDAAVLSGDYEQVGRFNGSIEPAYALTDSKEYFAELTEAYFWRNDFYPFDREQLQTHDIKGYEAIEIMWQL